MIADWIRSLYAKVKAPRVAPAPDAPLPEPLHAMEVRPSERTVPAPQPELFEPDAERAAARESRILFELGQKIEAGEFHLPHLPLSSARLIDLLMRPGIDFSDVVAHVEQDKLLAQELLKVANSVLFAGAQAADSLRSALVRLGLKNLRGLILAVSMKRVVLRNRALASLASDVWAQALRRAAIACRVAPFANVAEEKAFLLGLLPDIGKVPLLDLLAREVKNRGDVTPSLVGKVYRQHHERLGGKLATAWNLPADLVAVCAHHHQFDSQEVDRPGAALASLVHRIERELTRGSEAEFFDLRYAPELDALGVPADRRAAMLQSCLDDDCARGAADAL